MFVSSLVLKKLRPSRLVAAPMSCLWVSISDQCIRWLPGITVSRLAILPTPITGAMYKGDVGRDIVTTQLKHVYIA